MSATTIDQRSRVTRWMDGFIDSIEWIAAFFIGWPAPKAALIAGALLLLTRRVKPEKVYNQVDWPLLVLFAGLFVVVAGMERSSLEHVLEAGVARLRLDNVAVLSALTAFISNLVSNVPAVMVFQPFVAHMRDPVQAWLTLAMSSTFAGNLTILGSIANLIVIQRAKPHVNIGFWEYARAGVPVTILSLVIGVWWLS